MKDTILNNACMHFPLLMKNMVEWRRSSPVEIVVKLDDGNSFLYNDLDNTIRRLPASSNNMTEEECRKEFSMRLYKLMYRKGITQLELSARTGISQPVLSNYVSGKTLPSFYNLDKIAKALNCSSDELRYID